VGASHFCRDNLLWGGHPARPLALTGKMPVPQENVFAQLGCSPFSYDAVAILNVNIF
jgi:hypothetical protein